MQEIDDNSNFNKEEKYRKEIFQLLGDIFKETNGEEFDLLEELFNGEQLDNKQLIKRITSIK